MRKVLPEMFSDRQLPASQKQDNVFCTTFLFPGLETCAHGTPA